MRSSHVHPTIMLDAKTAKKVPVSGKYQIKKISNRGTESINLHRGMICYHETDKSTRKETGLRIIDTDDWEVVNLYKLKTKTKHYLFIC